MKKIAYFDSTHDLPEEIIMAAGFEPYKIMGDVRVPNDPADAYLANFFCPVARSCMVEALAGSGNWAGIVFGHGCDATNRHFDVWKRHVDTPVSLLVQYAPQYEPYGRGIFQKRDFAF